jgi:hypothetical protein
MTPVKVKRGDLHGKIGSPAHFHSLTINNTSKIDPSVTIEMNIALSGLNWVLTPEIGTKSNIVPIELNNIPK